MVTLEEVCDITVKQGPAFIKREDLSRYMVLSLEVEDRDIASFVEEANAKIEKEVKIPDGYYIKWAGDFKNMQEATADPCHDHTYYPASDRRTYFCSIVGQPFNSFKKAFLILLGVPLGMIGGIVGLLISGEYLSVSAIVGFISKAIFAIAILNGIVLVSFIDELRKKFPTVKTVDLVKDATLLRLRPVLMTALYHSKRFGILPSALCNRCRI